MILLISKNNFYNLGAELSSRMRDLFSELFTNYLNQTIAKLIFLQIYLVFNNLLISKISQKYLKNQTFIYRSKLFLHHNKFKIPGITVCGS